MTKNSFVAEVTFKKICAIQHMNDDKFIIYYPISD